MPDLAILMLSWRRFPILLESLRDLPKTFKSPAHLILRVQGSEDLTYMQRKQVHEAASGFDSTDIYFTRDNIGTAAARLDLIHRGAKAGYKYLMFTDDDITFPDEGIDRQLEILDKYPDIGSISIRPRGIKKVPLVVKDGAYLTTYNEVEDDLVEVYLVGSASLMFRSFLYTKYLVAPDPAFYIGTWDWDFVTQIRDVGYKVCVITDIEIINKRGGDPTYRSKRRNQSYIVDNRLLFIEKWGFDPIKSRGINTTFNFPATPAERMVQANKDLITLERDVNMRSVRKQIRNISKGMQLNKHKPMWAERADEC